ncbi:MAG: hypothetical protein ACOCUH_00605, partial [Bacteriovoracia bacterium]
MDKILIKLLFLVLLICITSISFAKETTSANLLKRYSDLLQNSKHQFGNLSRNKQIAIFKAYKEFYFNVGELERKSLLFSKNFPTSKLNLNISQIIPRLWKLLVINTAIAQTEKLSTLSTDKYMICGTWPCDGWKDFRNEVSINGPNGGVGNPDYLYFYFEDEEQTKPICPTGRPYLCNPAFFGLETPVCVKPDNSSRTVDNLTHSCFKAADQNDEKVVDEVLKAFAIGKIKDKEKLPDLTQKELDRYTLLGRLFNNSMDKASKYCEGHDHSKVYQKISEGNKQWYEDIYSETAPPRHEGHSTNSLDYYCDGLLNRLKEVFPIIEINEKSELDVCDNISELDATSTRGIDSAFLEELEELDEKINLDLIHQGLVLKKPVYNEEAKNFSLTVVSSHLKFKCDELSDAL